MPIRNIVSIVIGVIVLGAIALAFMPQAVPADLVEVQRGSLAVTVHEEGRTRVKDIYTVSAPVGGRLLRIRSDVGDPVTERVTVVATIQPTDPSFLDARSLGQAEALAKAAEAARTLAEADVARAQAELDFAQSEYRRAKSLAAKGTVSQARLDKARLDMRTRAAALDEAKAAFKMRDFELENARALLIQPGEADGDVDTGALGCCVPVRAPITGRVLRIMQESEAIVLPGAPLIEVGDAADLEIVVDLLSEDAVRVSEGDRVLVEDWGGTQDLNGTVRRIEPFGFTKVSALGIEEQRVNVIIDFEDTPEAWSALGHGYRLDTRIFVWEAEDVLKLPVSALFRDGDAWVVFREAEGEAALTPVEIGRRNALEAEVVAGLEAGDRVVVHPSDRVVDGVSLEPRGLR
ncbi:HlyD family efflux transporter periplasmic adaptor subunit [Pyruvatibacter sp. HU-CL02332]|uniref:efflux RND transporter periplasmic adaptor subunit n=1 Tax=Pyruvatibacter sp. HU-CL02332 TaxID=3127650 RepID=UPI003101D194